jgi:hypothetical protein
MGWSVVTNAKVFALVGVFGDARKGFIFKLLVLQLAYGSLAPYSLTSATTVFTILQAQARMGVMTISLVTHGVCLQS